MAEQANDSAAEAGPTSSVDAFEVHRQMVLALFTATLAVTALLVIALLLARGTILIVVGAAGALGGFVSALRRLYSFQRVFPLNFLKKRRRLDVYLVVYSMIPSLVGLVAAVVLYAVFASQLVTGNLFPSFHLSPDGLGQDAFRNFIRNWQPVESTDHAKAIVWGFIAGFSERFVPDLLAKFASTQQSTRDQ